MTAHAPALVCAGLSPHESAMVRLVLEALKDRLHDDWRLIEPGEADAILADPHTRRGREIIADAGASTTVIAVIDRHGESVPESTFHLRRPLRPAALIQILNDARPGGDFSDEASHPIETDSLAHAVRQAHLGAASGTIAVIEPATATGAPLVVDVLGDQIRGPYKTIESEHWYQQATHRVHRTGLAQAKDVASGEPNTPLGVFLWESMQGLGTTPVFGNASSVRGHMRRWPHHLAPRLIREQLRAATLLQHKPSTVDELAALMNADRGMLITLFNASWLTGALNVTAIEKDSTRASQPQPEDAATSLFSRIRNRLGAVSN